MQDFFKIVGWFLGDFWNIFRTILGHLLIFFEDFWNIFGRYWKTFNRFLGDFWEIFTGFLQHFWNIFRIFLGDFFPRRTKEKQEKPKKTKTDILFFIAFLRNSYESIVKTLVSLQFLVLGGASGGFWECLEVFLG